MIKTDMGRRGPSIGQQLSSPRAYKRSPALTNSTWYKGMLHSQMAGTADNNGAFDFVISKMRRGTEPPPHIHAREDEFFYVLSGKIRVYVGREVFSVSVVRSTDVNDCCPGLRVRTWVIIVRGMYAVILS
jgi:mannose-6-phosphate isomerase-like protein (cupin superfamily)